MLLVRSRHSLARVSTALHRSAHRHRAMIQTIHLAQQPSPVAFLVTNPELQHRLLDAEPRLLACLPWHIGAREDDGGTILESLAPSEVCTWMQTDQAGEEARQLELFLVELLNDAAEGLLDVPHQAVPQPEHYGLGATETQVNMRGTIPQRIDKKGTKVEEIAGTGRHDAQGG